MSDQESIEQQIGFSDEFSYNDQPIKYEITKDNILRMYVEDCALALGVVKGNTVKDGSISYTARWDRVYDDLVGIERIPNSGIFKDMTNEVKKDIRNELKNMTITEPQLYLWSFRVESEQGKQFRNWLANTVLPNLREHGIYVTGMENMTAEEVKSVTDQRIERYILRKFGIGIRRELTDVIQKIVKPAPFEGYKYAIYTNLVYRVLFGMDCKEYKEKLGLNGKDSLRDNVTDQEINNITKAEDFMGNLMMSGITDVSLLKNFMGSWFVNVNKGM